MQGTERLTAAHRIQIKAEQAQNMLPDKWAAFAGQIITGSTLPIYKPLIWRPEPAKSATRLGSLVGVEGDPDAKGTPKSWDTAYVVGALTDEVEWLRGRYPRARDAVGYVYQGILHAGRLARSATLFGDVDDYLAVAGRRGPHDIEVTIGVQDPHTKEFIGINSPSLEVLEPNITKNDLQAKYAGTLALT